MKGETERKMRENSVRRNKKILEGTEDEEGKITCSKINQLTNTALINTTN